MFTAAGLNVLTGMLKESTLNTVFRVVRNGETVAEGSDARLQLFGEVVHEVIMTCRLVVSYICVDTKE